MSCTVTPASSTGQGFFILPNPEIDFCVTNNCFQHCVTTGASGHLYNDSVLDSLNIQNINLDVPENFDNEAISNRTGVYHGLIVKSGLVDFNVENSQVGLFEGGFIKTEASLSLDLSEQDTWSVDFWINTQNDYTGIENAPYGTKDIALFTISGEVGAENGNTLFSVGYTLESGVSGISGLQKTVKPYSDLSGIQSDENYYTGFFTDSGVWQHFAFVKEYTGYATYLDGYRVGKVIPKNQLDPYVPSGRSIFYFGGLPSGKFEPFNTGQNQQFATGSDVDLLLHFNDNLVDSGRYEQTIVSGGFPVFQTDSKYGGYSVNFTGLEYIETSGEHFNYGTGDFTIECWIKPSGITKGTNITGNAVQTLWALGEDGGSFTTGNGIALLLNYHTNGLRLAFAPDNQEMQVDLFPPFKPTTVEIGEWNHIALQRENNVFYSFINGIPAGAFGDSDFAQNAVISQYFTGNPVFDFGSDQKFFIGGTMEGNKTTFVVPTGDLYDTQPSKLDRAASLETLGLVKKSNPLDPYTNRYITYRDQFPFNTAEVNKPYFAYHNIVGVPAGTGSGYAYDYKCSPSFTGDLYVYASCTSRWGRAINTNGVSTSVARLFKDDVESAELRWEHGGDSVYSDDPRYSPDKDYLIGTFKDDPNFLDGSPGQSIRGKYYPPFMSGCYTDVFLAHKITGFSSGQEFKFVCNRYGNEGIIGNTKFNDAGTSNIEMDNGAANMLDYMHRRRIESVQRPINSDFRKYQNLDYVNFYDSKTFLKLPRQTAAGADIVHINSLIIKQTLHENFVGQIDELRISSGVARYSSESPTGIYDSGFLNSDLGDRVFIDNLILSKAPAFSYDNGAYEMPTSGNTQADNFNFETPIDLGNIVTNGITGSAGANAILKTYEIVGPNSGTNVRFSESGNAKFGDYSAQFPTGAPMTGSGNFLFSDYDINFNTGDFTVEFWFKPSGNAYDDGIVEPTFLFGTGTGLGQTPTTGDITGTGIPTTGEAVSGNLDAQTLFSIGDYNSGFNIFLTGNYAQEADTSGVARDLRIGLNLSNGRDLLDTTGTASGGAFDTNTEPVGSERFHIFEQYGADSQWISGDWNHLAFSRKDRNFYLHLNGRFAGNINYTGVSQYTGFSNEVAFGQENPLTGSLSNDDYTKLQHIGSDNFYITGESGCHNMNISGRMVFGGGCAYVSNYQGEIDAINISLGTPYTGIYSAPKHLHTCDKDDLLVVKFDRPSGSVYFEDSHCCATGVEGTGRWGEIVGIHGSGFFDITGILFGANRVPSRDWFVPEREYINATIPQGAESGPTVIVGSGFSEVTGCHLEIIPVDTEIYGFSPASGFTNQTINVSGQSLNRFENIFIFDNTGQRLQIPFTRIDFTGITFTIPTGIDCALPTHTDIIFSGLPQFITGNTSGEIRIGSLRINSSGIKSASVGSGVFGEEVSFSGSYFNSGVDIPMFPAYQTGVSIYDPEYVQTNYVPALDIEYIGVTGVTAKVPKEIVHGDLILSGSGNAVTINCGKEFVPIPTITGVTKTLYKNGSSIVITGVNACYIHPYIGFTGSNAQTFHNNSDPVNQNVHSQVSFIANSGNIEEYLSGLNEISGVGYSQLYPSVIGDSTSGYNDVMYNGNIFINKDQLDINYPESSKTGFVIISGFINSTTIGTGNPFLVSSKEISNGEYYDSGDYGVSGFKDNFFNTGSFVYARDNISSVTGDQIEISGNCPDFSGLLLGGGLYWVSPGTGDENTLVTISGLHFADLTGIKVEANDGSTMCHISTGDFDRFVELETGFNEATNKTEVFAVRTGHHFDRFYQGTGEYINPINWINRAELNLCSELKNNQNVTISPLYDSGICTTGII
tara:strand:+ start:12691 stop:18207 length:5517 start_codon:yes stop_codon:yes gene_type:complete